VGFFSKNEQKESKVLPNSCNLNKNELLMLLVRPSLVKVFSRDSNDILEEFKEKLNSLNVFTFFVLVKGRFIAVETNNINGLNMVPVLTVSESGHIGYVYVFRLILQNYLQSYMNNITEAPIEATEFFGCHDIIMVSNGIDIVRVFFDDQNVLLQLMQFGFPNEFKVPDIFYFATVADNVTPYLRELEDVSKLILSKYKDNKEPVQVSELPKLPFEVYDKWNKLFLKSIFGRARKSIE